MEVNNLHEKQSGSDATQQKSPGASEHNGSLDSAGERFIDTTDLFQGEQEVKIRHNDAVYRLRNTRFGKLLLTK